MTLLFLRILTDYHSYFYRRGSGLFTSFTSCARVPAPMSHLQIPLSPILPGTCSHGCYSTLQCMTRRTCDSISVCQWWWVGVPLNKTTQLLVFVIFPRLLLYLSCTPTAQVTLRALIISQRPYIETQSGKRLMGWSCKNTLRQQLHHMRKTRQNCMA